MNLAGCSPQPLAFYLKALGILRLVAEQADRDVRGHWSSGAFVLKTEIDLEEFFLNQYSPTPLVAPWNGGSGFAPKDTKAGIDTIRQSNDPRLQDYRVAIGAGFRQRERLGITDKAKDKKDNLILACRGWLPDRALSWMDAALILTSGGLSYPPILGTGGNDGRLDFSNNFMQRLVEVFAAPAGQSLRWLRNALWASVQPGLQKAAVGQFQPSAAGGANGTSGFESEALVNPWDFILMLEGSLLFAASSTRRLGTERPSAAACPFHVRTVGAGYGSAASADEGLTRSELWAPLWDAPASLGEIKTLFAEGRAQIKDRPVANGVDFARAICGLGVDRGLSAFVRYAFLERNGQAYLAVPLGRYEVRRRPEVGLIDSIGSWLDNLRSKASGDKAPASVRRAVRNLDESILAWCRQGGSRLEDVLIAVGQCEKTVSTSLKWATESYLRPCGSLPMGWLEAVPATPEGRLAISLSSIQGLRSHMEPWRFDEPPSNDVVGADEPLVDRMLAILYRRLIQASQAGMNFRLRARQSSTLSDVEAFIEGRVDDTRISNLLWGLCLLSWKDAPYGAARDGQDDARPAAPYALLKLCFYGHEMFDVPLSPDLIHLAATGDSFRATAGAIRRLRGSGSPPALGQGIELGPQASRRTAAAVLFPVQALSKLKSALHIKEEDEEDVPA